MTFPQAVCLDRDGVLCLNSANPASPLYYILSADHLILKPRVAEAIQILRAHKVPIVLATKQRCISKGLITRGQVDDINRALEEILGIQFAHVLVEESAETKGHLYAEVLRLYPQVFSRRIYHFDDSEEERGEAWVAGLWVADGTDLFTAVCEAFDIRA
jgi:hypothetical protein